MKNFSRNRAVIAVLAVTVFTAGIGTMSMDLRGQSTDGDRSLLCRLLPNIPACQAQGEESTAQSGPTCQTRAGRFPTISGDGRYVAYYTEFSDEPSIPENERNISFYHVFLLDRQTGVTKYIGPGTYPELSDNGKTLAHVKGAMGSTYIIYNVSTGQRETVNISGGGGQLGGIPQGSFPNVMISRDGRYVLNRWGGVYDTVERKVSYWEAASFHYSDREQFTESVPISHSDTAGRWLTFLRNPSTGVLITPDDGDHGGHAFTHASTNGIVVTTHTVANDRDPSDPLCGQTRGNQCMEGAATITDLNMNDKHDISCGDDQGLQISGDGKFLVCTTDNALVTNDTNQLIDVYLYDIQNRKFELASKQTNGSQYMCPGSPAEPAAPSPTTPPVSRGGTPSAPASPTVRPVDGTTVGGTPTTPPSDDPALEPCDPDGFADDDTTTIDDTETQTTDTGTEHPASNDAAGPAGNHCIITGNILNSTQNPAVLNNAVYSAVHGKGKAYFGNTHLIEEVNLDSFTIARKYASDAMGTVMALALDTDRGYLYAADTDFSDTLHGGKAYRIRLSDFTKDKEIELPGTANETRAIAVHPKTGNVYVTYRVPGKATVTLIRGSDFTAASSLDLGMTVFGGVSIAIDDENNFLYVANQNEIVKVRLDGLTMTKVATLAPVSGFTAVTDLKIDVKDGYLYATNSQYEKQVLSKIALSSFTVEKAYTLDRGEGVALIESKLAGIALADNAEDERGYMVLRNYADTNDVDHVVTVVELRLADMKETRRFSDIQDAAPYGYNIGPSIFTGNAVIYGRHSMKPNTASQFVRVPFDTSRCDPGEENDTPEGPSCGDGICQANEQLICSPGAIDPDGTDHSTCFSSCPRDCEPNGDTDNGECSALQCGENPNGVPVPCADGSTPASMCVRSAQGVCGWRFAECPRQPVSRFSDEQKCTGYTIGHGGAYIDPRSGQQTNLKLILGPDGTTYKCTEGGSLVGPATFVNAAIACSARQEGDAVTGISYNRSTHFYDLMLQPEGSNARGTRNACSEQLASWVKQNPLSWSAASWTSLIDVVAKHTANIQAMVTGAQLFEVQTVLSDVEWSAGLPVNSSFTVPQDSEKFYASAKEFAAAHQTFTAGVDAFLTRDLRATTQSNQYHRPLKNWTIDFPRLRTILSENAFRNYELNGTHNPNAIVMVATASRIRSFAPRMPAPGLTALGADEPVILVLDYGIGKSMGPNPGNYQNFIIVHGSTGKVIDTGTWVNGSTTW